MFIPQEEKEPQTKTKKFFKPENEDDEDEEMPDMENNPFALVEGRTNEKLYGTDPKKFLKEWYKLLTSTFLLSKTFETKAKVGLLVFLFESLNNVNNV